MNNAYTNNTNITVATIEERVWKKDAATGVDESCIYGSRITVLNEDYWVAPGSPGSQSLNVNGFARSGFSNFTTLNSIQIAYYYSALSDEVLFRAGRSFTSVQHRASLADDEVAATGYVTRPTIAGGPPFSSPINGVGTYTSPLIVPTAAQQATTVDANWIEFTTDLNWLDDDGTSLPTSPMLYVLVTGTKACPAFEGGIPALTTDAYSFRQTGQEEAPLIEFRSAGYVPAAASIGAVTTTSLTVPATITAGASATLSATVTGVSPTGVVTFKDGSSTLGTGTLTGSGATTAATLSVVFNTIGSHIITATYEGDATDAPSTSTDKTVAVTIANTTTTLTAPTTAVAGANVLLTATISNSAVPTGNVTFKENGIVLGVAAVSSGVATYTTQFLTVGTHANLTAEYAGDANNTSSVSSAQTVNVTIATSTTLLTTSLSTAAVSQPVTLTATVNGAAPTGTVTFKDGTTTLGTETLVSGAANYIATFSTTGSHSITVVYSGDTNNTASTSPAKVVSVVTKAPTITVLSTDVSQAVLGQTVLLTAAVTGFTPTGTVTFKDGTTTKGTGTLSGSGNTTTATLSTTFSTVSSHSLTAVYAGDTNDAASTSAAVVLPVKNATTTVLTLSPDPVIANQSVIATATVTGATPTGVVGFYDNLIIVDDPFTVNGPNFLGSATITSGVATTTIKLPATGTRKIVAFYYGSTTHASSSSAPRDETVVPGSLSTITLNALSTSLRVNESVSLVATVNGNNPAGTVVFKDGTTTIGSVAMVDGVATLNTSFTTTGTHSVTASYGGDAVNVGVTSSVTSLVVTAKTTSTTVLTVAPTPAAIGQTVTFTATVTGITPTGTVDFKQVSTGSIIGNAPVINGVAILTKSFTTSGALSYTATYSGDTNNNTSVSAAKSLTITAGTTTTILNISPNPAAIGQSITLTATVIGTSPTGTVTFKEGATTLGTGTLTAGIATFNTGYATVGTRSITAVYGGSTGNATSTSSAVNLTIDLAGPLGAQQNAYDSLGRLISIQYGNGTVVNYSYDATGNRTEYTVMP
jgi:YD repeat-containing protein